MEECDMIVYSSKIKRNKGQLAEALSTVGEISYVLIFVRQNPRGDILDVSGGVKKRIDVPVPYTSWQSRKKKQKTYNYYRCRVVGKTRLKELLRLIQLEINCIHWIVFC